MIKSLTHLMFTIVTTLTLVALLMANFQAQENDTRSMVPGIKSADSATDGFSQPPQSQPILDHTMGITYTPAFTLFLPIIIKNYPPVFDFEGNCEGWGKQPLNQLPQPCQGVTPSIEIALKGSYSLKFDVLGPYATDTTQDVGLGYDAYRQKVTAFVNLPKDASSIPVIIYIQDGTFKWWEGRVVNLVPGKWTQVSFNSCSLEWPHPFKSVGLHFTPSTYTGPVFIDNVMFEKC